MLVLTVVALVFSLLNSASAAGVQVWTEPAATKILEDAEASAHATRTVRLSAARREFAAFQIVLSADADVKGLTAKAPAPEGPGRISARNITIWREHYVNTNEGRKPDPLSLLKSVDLKAGVAQPLYVEIEVPANAKAGSYEGTIELSAGGAEAGQVRYHLTVRDFALPLKPSLRTAFGIQENCIARQEKISGSGPTFEKYRKAYYELLLSHRVSAYNIPADLMTGEGAKYLNDPRMTSYVIPYSGEDAKLKALCDHLRAGGWLDKGYFYIVDEPYSKDSFEQIDKHVARLKRLVPDYRLVSPYFRNPDFDEKLTVYDMLKGKVNIWCYATNFYDEKVLDERAKAGEEVWNYVCCGPGKPYANFFVTMPAMSHRMLFWQEWKYRSSGLLYWSTTYWEPAPTGTDDPWEDMATVKWITKDLFGDGSLLYPGHKVGHYGPLPSLRLKIIRQGLQDYEYIAMAAKVSPEEADRIVNSQVISWTEFQGAPEPIETEKDALALVIARSARR